MIALGAMMADPTGFSLLTELQKMGPAGIYTAIMLGVGWFIWTKFINPGLAKWAQGQADQAKAMASQAESARSNADAARHAAQCSKDCLTAVEMLTKLVDRVLAAENSR